MEMEQEEPNPVFPQKQQRKSLNEIPENSPFHDQVPTITYSNNPIERLIKVPDAANDDVLTPSGERLKPVLLSIPADRVKVSETNTRIQKFMDISELEDDIKAHKTNLIPVLVVRLNNDPDYDFELIYGSRRCHICKKHKFQLLALVVDKISKEDALYYSTVENQNRKEMTPFEKCRSFCLFIQWKIYKDITQLAENMGIDRTYASQIYNLKTVPERLYAPIVYYKCTWRSAKTIKKLWDAIDADSQEKFLNELDEEDRIITMPATKLIEKLKEISPLELFERKKKSIAYGDCNSFVSVSQQRGDWKHSFTTDKELTEEQIAEIARICGLEKMELA